MIMPVSNFPQFSILEHLDRLEVNEKKSSQAQTVAACPCCGEDNLKIQNDSGKYQCFSGCDTAAVREAIRPWDEVKRGNRSSTQTTASTKPRPKAKPKPKAKPAPLPSRIHLAKLAGNVETVRPTEEKGRKYKGEYCPKTQKRIYPYGEGQRIERIDFFNAGGERVAKECYYQHLTPGSGWIAGKGDQDWLPYRIEEVRSFAQGRFVLAGEGEKVTEAARLLGLVCVSFRLESKLTDHIKALSEAGAGGLVYLPDNDKAGQSKARKMEKAAAAAGLPLLCLSLSEFFEEAKMEGGDLADIVKARLKAGGVDGIVEELEAAVSLTLEEATLPASDEETPERIGSAGEVVDELWQVHHESVERLLYRQHFGNGEGNWCVIDGNFYEYTGLGYWRKVESSELKSKLTLILNNCYRVVTDGEDWSEKVYDFATKSKLNSCYEYLLSTLLVFDRPQSNNLIAFGNGTLDLSTGELLPHSKEHYLTWAIPTDYAASSVAPPIFEQFVNDSYGLDFMPIIRAWIASILDPSAPYGKFLHAIGPSGSGKGTLLRLIANLLPPEAVARLESFADISTPEKRHQFLSGSRLCLFPDLGGHQRSLRAFYELVDNGGLSGRGLFNPDGYSRQWDCKFMIASVDHLSIENAGDGWARRAIPLPSKRRRGKGDPHLESKLASERGAIIAWAMGMEKEERDLILAQASEHPAIAAVARDAAIYGDSVRSFLDAALQPSEAGVAVSGQELHQLYQAFCTVVGSAAFGYQKFISHLKNLLPDNHIPSRVVKEAGRCVRLPAHWIGLELVEGAFIFTGASDEGDMYTAAHTLGNCSSSHRNIKIECVKGKLTEGNLARFEGEDEEALPAAVEEETVEEEVRKALSKASTVTEWQAVGSIPGYTEEMYSEAIENLSLSAQARVNRLCELYAQGLSGYKLNDRIEYKDGYDASTREAVWRKGTVKDLMSNGVYISIDEGSNQTPLKLIMEEELHLIREEVWV